MFASRSLRTRSSQIHDQQPILLRLAQRQRFCRRGGAVCGTLLITQPLDQRRPDLVVVFHHQDRLSQADFGRPVCLRCGHRRSLGLGCGNRLVLLPQILYDRFSLVQLFQSAADA